MLTLRTIIFALTAATLTGCATSTPKVVDNFARRNNLEVGNSFSIAPSIRGYAIENVRGGKGVIYVVDGKYAFIGNMVGDDGEPLTKQHLQTYVYDLPGAFARLEKESSPIGPDPASTIYGFYEPQCNYCVHAIEELKDAGIHVKWVPVLMFGQVSINALAAIYASTDEEAALTDAARAQREGKLGEWVSAQTYGTANVKTAVDRTALHESIMKQAGFSGTPMFLTKVKGQVVPLTTPDLLALRARYLTENPPADAQSQQESAAQNLDDAAPAPPVPKEVETDEAPGPDAMKAAEPPHP